MTPPGARRRAQRAVLRRIVGRQDQRHPPIEFRRDKRVHVPHEPALQPVVELDHVEQPDPGSKQHDPARHDEAANADVVLSQRPVDGGNVLPFCPDRLRLRIITAVGCHQQCDVVLMGRPDCLQTMNVVAPGQQLPRSLGGRQVEDDAGRRAHVQHGGGKRECVNEVHLQPVPGVSHRRIDSATIRTRTELAVELAGEQHGSVVRERILHCHDGRNACANQLRRDAGERAGRGDRGSLARVENDQLHRPVVSEKPGERPGRNEILLSAVLGVQDEISVLLPEHPVTDEVKHVMLPREQRLADRRPGHAAFEHDDLDCVAKLSQRILDNRAFHRHIEVRAVGDGDEHRNRRRCPELVDRFMQGDIAGQRGFR